MGSTVVAVRTAQHRNVGGSIPSPIPTFLTLKIKIILKMKKIKKYKFEISRAPKENEIKEKSWKRITGLNVDAEYPQVIELALPEIRLLTKKKLGKQISFPLNVPKKLKKFGKKLWMFIQSERKNPRVEGEHLQPGITQHEGTVKKRDIYKPEKVYPTASELYMKQVQKEKIARLKRKGLYKAWIKAKTAAKRKAKSKELGKIYAAQKARGFKPIEEGKVTKVVQMSSLAEKSQQAKAA